LIAVEIFEISLTTIPLAAISSPESVLVYLLVRVAVIYLLDTKQENIIPPETEISFWDAALVQEIQLALVIFSSEIKQEDLVLDLGQETSE
jgi:hypothetical protein